MKAPRWVSILSLLFLLFGFANYIVYSTLASIFEIENSGDLIWLASIIGFLSASFIAATFLGHKYYNFFTRIYYKITAIWIALFIYWFFSAFIYSLAIFIFENQATLIGKVLVYISALAVLYGYFNAKKIRIKKVEINLPDLPASWKGKSLLFVSDLHLGQINGPDFAKKVVNKCNEISADLVAIGGDLFDGTEAPGADYLIDSLRGLKSKQGVFFVTGNHEEFRESRIFSEAIKNIGIRILEDELIDIDGLQIIGVDYENASSRDKFANILSNMKIDKSRPTILLKHEPKDLDISEQTGINLQISGHTHKAQMWPLEYIARLSYKGYAYGLKKFNKMQVYVSSGAGTWGPPVRVGTSAEIVMFVFK